MFFNALNSSLKLFNFVYGQKITLSFQQVNTNTCLAFALLKYVP